MLVCLERVTGPDPFHSVIWLHGLGADAGDFWPVVPELGLPSAPAWRFVFPNAPVRPVTVNGGMPMRAWFDILSLERMAPMDGEGIEASCRALEDLIVREEQRGIARNRIVLAGFSQGGAMTYRCGMDRPDVFAGLVALSAAVFDPELLRPKLPEGRSQPIFVAHGTGDMQIAVETARATRAFLEAEGYAPEYREYNMGHEIPFEVLRDLIPWLTGVLPPLRD